MFSGTNPPYTFQYRFVNTKQENEMYVPSNPHEAYAFGVKQATEPLREYPGKNCDLTPGSCQARTFGEFANAVLADRRKRLLTKKVTKWTNVYFKPGSGDLSVGCTADSELEAKAVKGGPGCGNYVGTFPFEVEVEL
jgi:hypothetical protein